MDISKIISLWGTTFLGNSLVQWAGSTLAFIALVALIRLSNRIISKRMHKFANRTKSSLDDVIADLSDQLSPVLILAISLYGATRFLTLNAQAKQTTQQLLTLAFIFQTGLWLSAIIQAALEGYFKRRGGSDPSNLSTMGLLFFAARVAVWSLALILALDNLGMDITALITGLGVGGVAVALAVQNILGDLFGSISIILDKPFEVGDFIVVGELVGTVERIGIKTTRLRSLSGEQLVVSNSDLLSSRIRNYKRMQERRVVFSIGTTYQTPTAKVKQIPSIIQEIIETQDQVRFDRAHFKSFGDFALIFEIVYYVLSPDYNKHMDIQQNINIDLMARFEQEKIEFAYPTQTILIDHSTSQTELP